MVDNKFLFEDMPVSKALAELAIPTIISQLIVMIYNLADTFFIGQTNEPLKIAAPAIASVLFFMLTAVANLFGIGGGTMVSRFLGMKDRKSAVSISSVSLYLSFAATLLYCSICLVFMKPILSMIGASENTLDYTCEYTFWVIVIGGIPVVNTSLTF